MGHGAVGKVHLSGRPQKNKMDVLKGEEGKRVASGGAALSADERRAALPGAVSRVANWPREVCSRVRCFPEQRQEAMTRGPKGLEVK